MLVIGDKIKLLNDIGILKKSEVFEVTNISNEGFITFRGSVGFGIMSPDEFEKNFELAKTTKPWSPWIHRITKDGAFAFKTNGKKIILKKGEFQTDASCHPHDCFDLNKGISLCLARIDVKAAKKKLEEVLSKI